LACVVENVFLIPTRCWTVFSMGLGHCSAKWHHWSPP